MPETTNPQIQIDQILAEVHLLLKRAEDRLNDTTEYVARHNLNHSINYIHQELLDFTDFRASINGEATAQWTEAQKNISLMGRALCLLALVNRALENYDLALHLAEKALALNPNEAKAYIEIASFHLRLHDYSRTIVVATQAIYANPNEAVAYWLRGQGYFYKNDFQTAIMDFDHAARLNPFETYIYLYLGDIYYRQAKYKESISYFTKVVELDPTSASGFGRRGSAYLKLNQYQEARADFNRAKLIYPGFAYQVTTSFNDIKPVKGSVLIAFIALCILHFFTPYLLGPGQGPNKLTLLEITGWVIFIGIFFWGNLRLKDIGLTLKHIPLGLALTFLTGIIFQYTCQAMRLFYNGNNIFVPVGRTSDPGAILQLYIFNIYPLLVLQELFFRGFLFPQVFLKLRGPNRVLSSMVVTTTIATAMQLLFFTLTLNPSVNIENILFGLVAFNYLTTSAYFFTRNLYWCIGISLLVYPSLEVFRLAPYILALLVAVIPMISFYACNLQLRLRKANIILINDLESDKRNFFFLITSKTRYIFILLFTLDFVLVGIAWLATLINDNISWIGFCFALIVIPWFVIVPELKNALRRPVFL